MVRRVERPSPKERTPDAHAGLSTSKGAWELDPAFLWGGGAFRPLAYG